MFILFIKNKNSRAWILIICDIIFIPLIGISYFANDKLDDTLKFLKDNLNAKYENAIPYFLTAVDYQPDYLDAYYVCIKSLATNVMEHFCVHLAANV